MTVATLAPGWVGESRGASFAVIAPGRVRLDEGELFVKSVAMEPGEGERAPLSIETAAGIATAKGTEFYVGNHSIENSKKEEKMKTPNTMRVLVLSGVVTLTNPFGTVAGEANDLLVATPDSAPVKETVKANSQFAVDLYKQVSKENEGKNIFFSPYSISSALAMTAEGARGETAAEMADVLHFPAAAKRVGDDAQLIPWRSSLIHTGFEQLNSVLDRAANDPAVIEKRERLTALRTKLAEAKAVTQKTKDWKAHRSCVDAENKLVAQINELAAQIDPFELNIANAIWAEKTFSIEAPYRERVGKHYGTGAFRAADFKGNADGEREKINSWVEGKTKDRIKDLIGEGILTDTTRMVLVNAIYFKGEWASPFKEANTKDADFTMADGTKATTPTMHGGSDDASYAAFNADGTLFATPDRVPIRGNDPGPARYPGAGGFAMAKLPYKGDEISMILIAPMAHDGLSAVEEKLSSARLDEWIGKLKQRQTEIVLPKFKLETNYTLGEGGTAPKGILPAMGMTRAFTDPRLENSADFSGMHVPASPMDALYIATVIHKAFLEVNEKGTEAAAATAVAMAVARSLPSTEPFTPVFKADRPFLMLIRHDATGAILFMGRMTTPAGTSGGLQAELKMPTTVGMPQEQLAMAKKAKEAVAKEAKLREEMAQLYKDEEANKEAIAKIWEKIQKWNKVKIEGRKLAQGVNMHLVLTNTTKADITTRIGGDDTRIMIGVTGPEAVNLPYNGGIHKAFFRGKEVTIKAGGTYTMVIPELRYGMRVLHRWLIGACGEYKVDASLRCTIEEKPVTIKAKPVSFKVVPAENVAVPKHMSLAGDMIRGKVLDVGTSQSFCTEITYTSVRLSVLEVYRGKAVVGKPVELVISGWLESEKKEAALFEKAMKDDKEVVVIMEKSYQPFVKKAMPHSLGRMKPDYAYRLSRGAQLPKDIKPNMMEATAEVRKQAEAAAKLPIGWTYDGKTLVSPWSAIKGRYAEGTPEGLACAKSGRPAFLAPKGLTLTVDRSKDQKSNGKFRRARRSPGVFYDITLTNTTQDPITVDALRSKNGKILWDESILFVCEWEVWLPIGYEGFTPDTEAAVIQPGQKLTTTMLFSYQHSFHTLVCLGDLNFRIYYNGASLNNIRGPIQKLRKGTEKVAQ